MVDQAERDQLLAFVAEKYYRDDHKQSEIAAMIGMTRSAVSRLLSEARQKGIVEIVIHHPVQSDRRLEEKLQTVLGLKNVSVQRVESPLTYLDLRAGLGRSAARLLSQVVGPETRIGISWGTTVQEAVEAYDPPAQKQIRVIQLVGVLGSTRHSYSAQILVEKLAEKAGTEGHFIYAPFIVENRQTAQSLLQDPFVERAVAYGRDCDLALVGIGTTNPESCSLYQSQHISRNELQILKDAGGVGDVCALYFNQLGEQIPVEFHQRRIGISPEDLLGIALRLAVAGGRDKAPAILGAIRGGWINALVTDHLTAQEILKLAGVSSGLSDKEETAYAV